MSSGSRAASGRVRRPPPWWEAAAGRLAARPVERHSLPTAVPLRAAKPLHSAPDTRTPASGPPGVICPVSWPGPRGATCKSGKWEVRPRGWGRQSAPAAPARGPAAARCPGNLARPPVAHLLQKCPDVRSGGGGAPPTSLRGGACVPRLQPGEKVPGEWMRTARIKKGPQLCPQPRPEGCAPSQLSQAALRPRGRWLGWERSATPGGWVWPSPSTPSTPGVTLLARSVRRPDFGFSENAVKH